MKTMQQIADDLGLARSTVSLCLSDAHTNYRISQATVQRVRDYADKIGFVPNRMAGRLGKHSLIPPVGLLLYHDSSFEKSSAALCYAMQRLRESGREFIIQGTQPEQQMQSLRLLRGMQIREIIMFGHFYEPALLSGGNNSERSKFAALLREIDFFCVDYNFPIPSNGIKHMYRMGIDRHKTLIDLMEQLRLADKGNFMIQVGRDYDEMLLTRKLIFDRRQLLPESWGRFNTPFESGSWYVEHVLAVKEELNIRTILVHDDRTAVGLIAALEERGVSVPDDIQVIGFDNLIDAPYFKVPLTTIEVPVMDNTRRVLDHIIDDAELDMTVENDAKIIWRESAHCD